MTKKIINPLLNIDVADVPFYFHLMDQNPVGEKFVVAVKSNFHQTDFLSTGSFTKPISKIITIK